MKTTISNNLGNALLLILTVTLVSILIMTFTKMAAAEQPLEIDTTFEYVITDVINCHENLCTVTINDNSDSWHIVITNDIELSTNDVIYRKCDINKTQCYAYLSTQK